MVHDADATIPPPPVPAEPSTPVHLDADLTVTSPAPVSARARDIALFLHVFGLICMGLFACFKYPQWEGGATTVLTVLAGNTGFLLGTKSALASPKGGG